MSRGRRTQLEILLSDEHRQVLESWQRSATVSAGLARRGRILLLLQEGAPVSRVAEVVGMERRHVYKWVGRFQHQGLDGLRDRRASRRARSGWG